MSSGQDSIEAAIDQLGQDFSDGWNGLSGRQKIRTLVLGGVAAVAAWIYFHWHAGMPIILHVGLLVAHVAVVLALAAGVVFSGVALLRKWKTWRTWRSRLAVVPLAHPDFDPSEGQMADFVIQVHGLRRRWFAWIDWPASGFRVVMRASKDGRPLYLWELPRRHARSLRSIVADCFGDRIELTDAEGLIPAPVALPKSRLELKPGRRDEWPFRHIPLGTDPKGRFAAAIAHSAHEVAPVITITHQAMPPQEWRKWLRRTLGRAKKEEKGERLLRDHDRYAAAERVETRREQAAIWRKIDDRGNRTPLFYVQVLIEARGSNREARLRAVEDMQGGFDKWQSENFFGAVGYRSGGSDAPWRAMSFDRRMRRGTSDSKRAMAGWEVAAWLIPWNRHCSVPNVVRMEVEEETAEPPKATLAGSGRMLATFEGQEIHQPPGEARAHTHVVGPTDSGKTTQLVQMALGDIAAKRAVVPFVDPKEGAGVDRLLARIPKDRWQDVVLIDPSRLDAAVGINLLENRDPERADVVAAGVLALFERLFHDVWGPRQGDIMANCLFTLLPHEGTTLCDIPLLLTDETFRHRMTRDLNERDLISFWDRYDKMMPNAQGEYVGTLLSRLRQILLWPRVRMILGQRKSTINLGHLLDHGGIVLARLPEEYGKTSELIGSVLFLATWQAVQARQSQPEETRKDAVAYWDEFYLFLRQLGREFPGVLSRARSYRWGLTLAHQYMDQLPPELKSAVGSSTRTKVYYRCGDDANQLASNVHPLTISALRSLERYEVAIGLNYEDGFRATTRPLGPALHDPKELADFALKNKGRTREQIEEEIGAVLSTSSASSNGEKSESWLLDWDS